MLIPWDQVKPHRSAVTPLIAIGCSAGGLPPLQQFLETIPKGLHAAFLVVQHFPDDYKTHLPEILAPHVALPVRMAKEGGRPTAGEILVLPTDHLFEIQNGKLVAKAADPEAGPQLIFDTLLRSMARNYSEYSMAVILSGSGTDGAIGARALNDAGGMVLAQSPETAQFPGMPQSVILAKAADMVADPETLAREVVRLARRPETQTPPPLVSRDEKAQLRMRTLENLLKRHAGFNIADYKQESVHRRLERRMGLCHLPVFDEYLAYLQNNPAECENLAKDMLISVTSFFRDPEAFARLRETILPGLVKESHSRQLRVWVPACASGEEAYTIAILIAEAIAEHGDAGMTYKIFATDLDREALQIAGQGVYPSSVAADIPPHLLDKYFTLEGDTYRIRRSIRENMIFAKHNILKDPPFNRLDLVSCRNLLIYLQPFSQQRVLSILNFALRMGGALMLGLSESTGEVAENFGPVDPKNHIYFKTTPAASILPEALPLAASGGLSTNYFIPVPIPSLMDAHPTRLLEAFTNKILGRMHQTCFVLNSRLEILYSFGQTRRHIGFKQGRASINLSELLPKSVSAALTTVAAKVLTEEKPCHFGPIHEDTEQNSSVFMLSVESFRPSQDDRVYLLVYLEDTDKKNSNEEDEVGLRESLQHISVLEEELRDSRSRLKAAVEELEASNEELQTSNEELHASNEELQSTNEELESVNEELQTLNNEHQTKIQELSKANEELDNFIFSADIANIFLDSDLRIQRFTPCAARRTGLLPHDHGRAITELSHPLLLKATEAAREILRGSDLVETSFPSEEGETMHLRARPYIRKDSARAGAIVTFFSIRNA
jgi:two-component system CheB/CheR fusion protein